MPMTPFMGVRISWLIVARKALLARLAASAASRASSSWDVRSATRRSSSALVARISASASSRLVTSILNIRIPSGTGRALSSNHARLPSGNSYSVLQSCAVRCSMHRRYMAKASLFSIPGCTSIIVRPSIDFAD